MEAREAAQAAPPHLMHQIEPRQSGSALLANIRPASLLYDAQKDNETLRLQVQNMTKEFQHVKANLELTILQNTSLNKEINQLKEERAKMVAFMEEIQGEKADLMLKNLQSRDSDSTGEDSDGEFAHVRRERVRLPRKPVTQPITPTSNRFEVLGKVQSRLNTILTPVTENT